MNIFPSVAEPVEATSKPRKFKTTINITIFKCSVTARGLDAAKEYAEKVIEARIENTSTLGKIQKEEYKHKLKCWSDSTVRG